MNACPNFNQLTDNLDTKVSSPERQGKTAQKHNILANQSLLIMAKTDRSERGTYYDIVIADNYAP